MRNDKNPKAENEVPGAQVSLDSKASITQVQIVSISSRVSSSILALSLNHNDKGRLDK